MKPTVFTLAAAIVVGLAGQASADSRALILASEDYRYAPDIGAAADAELAADPLEDAGFEIVLGRSLTADKQRQALRRMIEDSDKLDHVVILLAGHFAQSRSGTWFLGTDARVPDLANVDTQGLSLTTVLEIASAAPGGAVVLLGQSDRAPDLGEGLRAGIGALAVPQGVTLIIGDVADVVGFSERRLAVPGQSLALALEDYPGLTASGYLSRLTPFLPASAEPTPRPSPQPDATAERTFWLITRSINSSEAYENFLRRFPNGVFARDARDQIERLRPVDPAKLAEADEAALRLTRDQRRAIQRDLTLVGHDTRGIDGVFGRGSRSAISRWQAANRLEATGFLSRDQIRLLSDQADRRAEELEAEAAARQLEEDRLDRDYWDRTGARGDEAGLRSYLRKYPDGLYADVAEDRLEELDYNRGRDAEREDKSAWETATRLNSPASYRSYLNSFPRGAYADDARERILKLEQDSKESAANAEAKAAEDQLNLGPTARMLIETRLDRLGLKPGAVDGRFDDNTRRAIRKFQRSRNMAATGYLNQAAVVQLLAGGVLKFGD